MKVFIVVFNRLAPLVKMVDFLNKIEDVEPVILNMGSTYPPLLEWLSKCSCEVMESKNTGQWKALWNLQNKKPSSEKYFAFTDPDLDLSDCPLDLFDVLKGGLDKYPKFTKAGLSLEINDIPDDFTYKKEVLRQETQFWKNRIDDEFYIADVATTLAVYRCGVKPASCIGPALRADRPYTAKHIDWYSNDLSAEEIYYLKNVKHNTQWSIKKGRVLKRTIPFL